MGSMVSLKPILNAIANVDANVHRDAVQCTAEEGAVQVNTEVNARMDENAVQLNTAPGTVDANAVVNAQGIVERGAVSVIATMVKDAVKVIVGTASNNSINFNVNLGGCDTVLMVLAMMIVVLKILGLMTSVNLYHLTLGLIAKEYYDGFPRVTAFYPALMNLRSNLLTNLIENSVNGGEVNVPPPTIQRQPVFSQLVQSKIRDPNLPFSVEERIEFEMCIKLSLAAG
jgi:hypothetical protein